MAISYNHQSKIRGALRQVARYMPEKGIALERVRSLIDKGPRGGAMYTCQHCVKNFSLKDIQVDHIEPVVPLDREVRDWNEYINRLFCKVDNLQVLCKPCHLIKSNYENEKRRNNKIH